MKNIILLFLLIVPFFVNAQTGTFTEYDKSLKISGKEHKNVMMAKAEEILIVHGDSIYILPSSYLIEKKIRQVGDIELNIINQPDSVQKYLNKRIKAIMILKDKTPPKIDYKIK